jgi:predicted dehydrogenase
MSIGVGLLGVAHGHVGMYCGRWTKEPALGVALKGVWDHDAGRAAATAKQFSLPQAESVAALLALPDVQAVIIASETALHAELVEAAAAAGKAIVLQKPLALTMSEADRIVAAVQRHGVPFTLAWQMRVDPQNLLMRQMIQEQTLGQVFMVRRRHGLGLLLNEAFNQSWHVAPKWNRDIWADDAAHPFDFMYWVLGKPATITAELATLRQPQIANDNGIAILRYPGGPLAEVCCSFTNPAGENTTEIVCQRGTIIQNFGDAISCTAARPAEAVGLKWFTNGQWVASDIPSPRTHGDRIAGLAGPLADFLQGRRPAIATAEEGREVLRMILATYVANDRGGRCSLDDPAILSL